MSDGPIIKFNNGKGSTSICKKCRINLDYVKYIPIFGEYRCKMTEEKPRTICNKCKKDEDNN